MMSSEIPQQPLSLRVNLLMWKLKFKYFHLILRANLYLTWNDKQTNSTWNGVNIYKAPLQEIIKQKKKKKFYLTLKNYLRFNEFHEFNKEFFQR